MRCWKIAAALVSGLLFGTVPAMAQEGDPAVLSMMRTVNTRLKAAGRHVAVEQIDFLTLGVGRPANRIHQQEFRWVAFDPRRVADGDNITYIVDRSGGATASGLTPAQTEAAIDRALTTWATRESCLRNVDIVKRPDPGFDITIFDEFFKGFDDDAALGDPFAADIVEAGWRPRAFFETVGGPGGGRGILAFSVSFVFTDDDGNPTDINGDNFLDTALNEVYYNDTFGQAGTDRVGNPWAINLPLPNIDVETVALHENGHSLELGHFGPPPAAVMNRCMRASDICRCRWTTLGCAMCGARGRSRRTLAALTHG
jgi:hypothetical protein